MTALYCIACALLASVVTRWAVHRICDGELRATRADVAALRAERERMRAELERATAGKVVQLLGRRHARTDRGTA
jgi:hypothetical protein